MDIVLYNPLSRNGSDPNFINKIINKLNKQGRKAEAYSLLDIEDVDSFVSGCDKDDRLIIVGGDGTLNRLANHIYGVDIKQDIFLYQAGTGNDFARSLKKKTKLIPIKSYLQPLPVIQYGVIDQYFLNGAGIGLDGYVGHLVNTSTHKKNKFNYFRHAIEAFIKFKPLAADITVDDRSWREKKVWFVSVMHGAYFGGGMKIAPKARREEDALYLVVAKRAPKWLLFLIFPTIYLGWHVMLKPFVSFHKGSTFKITMSDPTYVQVDGDVTYPVQEIRAKARA